MAHSLVIESWKTWKNLIHSSSGFSEMVLVGASERRKVLYWMEFSTSSDRGGRWEWVVGENGVGFLR